MLKEEKNTPNTFHLPKYVKTSWCASGLAAVLLHTCASSAADRRLCGVRIHVPIAANDCWTATWASGSAHSPAAKSGVAMSTRGDSGADADCILSEAHRICWTDMRMQGAVGGKP